VQTDLPQTAATSRSYVDQRGHGRSRLPDRPYRPERPIVRPARLAKPRHYVIVLIASTTSPPGAISPARTSPVARSSWATNSSSPPRIAHGLWPSTRHAQPPSWFASDEQSTMNRSARMSTLLRSTRGHTRRLRQLRRLRPSLRTPTDPSRLPPRRTRPNHLHPGDSGDAPWRRCRTPGPSALDGRCVHPQ